MKKKILIIDDEEAFTKLVKLNLERTEKYQVKTEKQGSRGLAAVKRFKPDLILLDVLMPEVGGGTVFAQIKEDESLKDIPVVFLTAAARKEEVSSRGGAIGGHPFIAKPVSKKKLIACIEQNIRS
ncbi:two-component system response regulator [Candidatus Omnitrophota bacterium]